ncbi:FecR domain-containing protein [Chitinophaga agrisoli]|nr:FecR domain-containing protein [Chitinophaga agrisoli]
MDEQTIIPLLEKYARGAVSPEEADIVTAWLQQVTPDEFDRVLQLCDVPEAFKTLLPIPPDVAASLESSLDRMEEGNALPRHGVLLIKRLAVAASVLLVLAAGAFYWLRKPAQQPLASREKTPAQPGNPQHAPGGNRAMLTLGDGSTISLDSAANGVLASQGNASIVKLANGQLAVRMPAANDNDEIIYNTITTPTGGQYQVMLPDGSKVWLNAASSLRFPNRFAGDQRNVTLTGEGYFEIAHNKAQPFRVQVNEATVEVLGTHFNVNAYNDEADVKTTLLEGAVKMSKGPASLLLAPGQQARLPKNGDLKLVKDADTEQVLAWKNGYFQFDKADLPALMRQIARWYDLEVVYEGPVKEFEFVGKIARNVYLADVLKALESSGVRFRMEGNKLIVMS